MCTFLKHNILVVFALFFIASCHTEEMFIVPDNGFSWPMAERDYWPTEGWESDAMEMHHIDAGKMQNADEFAQNDPLVRAVLVVKDGYLVFEKYYGDGGPDKSTNLWSVTKSVSSALVGLLIDEQIISSTNEKMAKLMPDYPEFKEITLHHVLTQTTGLSWTEEGPLWVDWIFSDDWVASALDRPLLHQPGGRFYYSSGNSHFLTALVQYSTGMSPGKLAKERLFEPLGIPFDTLDTHIEYSNWKQYTEPLHQTWRRDPNGIETASFALYLTARDMAKFGYLYLNRGKWENQNILSEEWIRTSTYDHVTNVYERYSYGYQWYLTNVAGHPAFLASGFGGQIIGVVPDLDLVVVLKYEAQNPVHPRSGTKHDDMHLFELVVKAVNTKS